jgi:hypothetical protein
VFGVVAPGDLVKRFLYRVATGVVIIVIVRLLAASVGWF